MSTDKKKIELIKRKAFEAILDTSYNGFIIIDVDGTILYANKWYFDFHGKDESIIGEKIDNLFSHSRLKDDMIKEKTELNIYDPRFKRPVIVSRIPLYQDDKLIGAVSFFSEVSMLEDQNIEIRRQMAKKGLNAKYTFENITTNSGKMEHAKTIAKTFALSDAPVMITGESGTGKEMFAQSIHNHSLRRNMPFVALNCATLTENMLESELFGYEEGSFTGAKKGGKVGLFQTAHNGTILLDEIGEMPLAFQTKLLRVIQEKQIRPIGSTNVIPINTRIIASTNRNLEEEVNKGNFRLDLYYRLNVLTIHIPPLRERIEDIPILAKDFFKINDWMDIWSQNETLLYEMFAELERLPLPGNIRELHNILERFVLLAKSRTLPQTAQEVVQTIAPNRIRLALTGTNDYPEQERQQPHKTLSADDQRRVLAITEALRKNNGNKQAAAEELGIGIATLYRRIKKYGL